MISRARPAAGSLLYSPYGVALLLGLGALALFLLYYLVLNQGTPTWWSDTYEYAVAARNVAEGRGLTNTAHYVLDTWLLRDFALPLPYVHHDVGLAVLMGAVMFSLRDFNAAVGWTGGIFYVAVVPLTFFFGWKLYNKFVGLLAALLALMNVQLLSYSTTGLSEVPYAFFMTLFWFELYRGRTRLEFFLSGGLFGWLWILRSNTLSALPWVLVFLVLAPDASARTFSITRQMFVSLWSTRRALLARVALFAAGLLLVLSPNLIRNYQTLGNPFYTVSSMYALVFYTDVFEGKNTEIFSNIGTDLNPVQYVLTHPDQLWSKMNYQLPQTFEYLWKGGLFEPTIVDAIEIVLFLVGALIPRRNELPRRRLFRWLIYLCIASALLLGSITHLRWRHLYGFLPVVLIFIAEFVLRLTEISPTTTRLKFLFSPLFIIVVVTTALAVPSALGVLRTVHNGHVLDREYRQMGRWLRQNTPDDALILIERGDASFGMQNAMAWYGRREIAEFADFTAQYFQGQRGARPLYVLFVMTKPQTHENALFKTGLGKYHEIADRPSQMGLNAVLYAPP